MRLPPRQSTAEADLMIPFQLVSDIFPLCLEVLMICNLMFFSCDVIFINLPDSCCSSLMCCGTSFEHIDLFFFFGWQR